MCSDFKIHLWVISRGFCWNQGDGRAMLFVISQPGKSPLQLRLICKNASCFTELKWKKIKILYKLRPGKKCFRCPRFPYLGWWRFYFTAEWRWHMSRSFESLEGYTAKIYFPEFGWTLSDVPPRTWKLLPKAVALSICVRSDLDLQKRFESLRKSQGASCSYFIRRIHSKGFALDLINFSTSKI